MRLRLGSLTIQGASALAILLPAAGNLVVAAQDAQTTRSLVQQSSPPVHRVMSLAPLGSDEQLSQAAAESSSSRQTKKLAYSSSNSFREFTSLRPAQFADARTLTLSFAVSATLTRIQTTPDFPLQQGGTCFEGGWYSAQSSCTLLVRFTPQGPGHRVGKLLLSNSVDATPLALGIGGYGSSPVVSFTPSVISTVPGTVSGGVGILSGASNLAVDGGDGLYMADTGNKLVRYLDATGNLQSLSFDFGLTDPQGIAVDNFDSVYVTQDNPATVQVQYLSGTATEYSSGSGSCAIGSTCAFANGGLFSPGAVTIDPNGYVFVAQSQQADKLIPTSGSFDNYIPLGDDYNYNSVFPSAVLPLAVDGNDTIYGYYNYNACFINATPYYDADQGVYTHTIQVAGARGCGFSGDGGQARGALIGNRVGQMVFDIAGNLYFTDTTNHRVRRIDALTGIINTIAGNGSVGNSGDGGAATNAQLSTPTGVTVDSQGQVYIISSSSTSSPAQLVRKVGTLGFLSLTSQPVGTPSSAQTVTLANTGNSELDFTHAGFSSGNSSDFSVDPNTTSCNFTAPLPSGRSCKIGFIFNPAATGARSATFAITDNTIAGVNTIQVNGSGYTVATLTPSSFSYAGTTVGASSPSQTATLTNTGKAVMTISSILISGSGASSYSDSTSCGSTLATGASCSIAITFKPTTSGTLAATLTVSDNGPGGHQTITLTGTGVAAAAKAVLSPTSLSFAATKVGSTTAAQIIKLSNTGTASLAITSITMSGSQGGDFPFTKTCGASVAAGSSCNISVSFKPATTGTRTASLSIVTSIGTLSAGVSGAGTTAVKAGTKTQLTALVNPAFASGAQLLRAQVSRESAAPPSGQVQLWDGTRILAETPLRDGSSEFNISHLRSGIHLLYAVYPGDAANAPSRSRPLRQVVSGRTRPNSQ